MRPANSQQAIRHMEHLLARKLTAKRGSRVKEHLNRAKRIAAIIYIQFQVGPYQYQVKHLLWYLEKQTNTLQPTTCYRHWLTVSNIIKALNKNEVWLSCLQGAWSHPYAVAGEHYRSKELE